MADAGVKTDIRSSMWNPGGLQSLLTFVILTLAWIVGFSSRLFAVIRFESIIHEFDPWFNYRATHYMVENGFYNFLNWFDDRAWYPLGRIVGGTVYPGLMVTSGTIHWILSHLNIPVHIRDICVFLAPIFSGLTALATYFFTKEVWSQGAGLFAACFIAIVPGYISRSVAGSYDNEGIAIFALMFTYYLWIKAVKTGSVFWAVLTALSYFYMVSAWGGYVFIINLIPLHVFVLLLMGRYSKRIFIAYTSFFIVGLICYIHPWSGRFYSLWDTGYAKIHIPIIASVSEHQPTTWVSFFFDLHILVCAFPAGVWYCVKEVNDERVFVILYAIFASYFAGVMVRLMLTLTPVVCVLAAIAFSKTFEIYLKDDSPKSSSKEEEEEKKQDNKNDRLYDKPQVAKPKKVKEDRPKDQDSVGMNIKTIIVIALLMMLMLFAVHCTWVTSSAYSSPSIVLASYNHDGSRTILDDFREAYFWLRQNTGDKARVMSWWDYGYQIAGIGYSGDDINKFLWMVRIAEGEHPKDIRESDYFTPQGEFRVDSAGVQDIAELFDVQAILLQIWRTSVILYAIFASYFAGVMVRLMLTLTPVVCVLAAIAFSKTFEIYLKDDSPKSSSKEEEEEKKQDNKNDRLYDKPQVAKPKKVKEDRPKDQDSVGMNIKTIIVIALLMMLMLFAVHCTWVTSSAYSSPSIVLASYNHDGSRTILDDFREAYFWLRQNTGDKARVMSWWDYGYQIAGMGNKTTLVDNNTWNNSHIALVGKAMSSNETAAYDIMRMLDVDYVLVIFGGVIGYSGDDINKFLWMVRIAEGEHPKDIRESDYFTPQGEFRVDSAGSKTLLNCLMYKLSYYRFGELQLDFRSPPGFDRTRNVEIGNKNFDLTHLEEAYTTEHWLVRIYRVKDLTNRDIVKNQSMPKVKPKKRSKKTGKKKTGSIKHKPVVKKGKKLSKSKN
ncbi:STT3 [Mytilus coruscus]|uniref:dolichyl-diphosphooligosaccharide--protein glycotransferase n=1 Tax=Mytilus coruscus TaxID=42192 RepID=A0A6J8A8B7_MYTCO|nr:STT3 [Mytilus coruscus]